MELKSKNTKELKEIRGQIDTILVERARTRKVELWKLVMEACAVFEEETGCSIVFDSDDCMESFRIQPVSHLCGVFRNK